MDGQTNGQTDEHKNRQTDERTDGRTNRRTDEQTNGWTEGHGNYLSCSSQLKFHNTLNGASTNHNNFDLNKNLNMNLI